ncbi:hypothetical protein L7F22_010436 [Adiantum nelumboides]|nr:hypothetical protein [Adiantum nelumboides]
MRQAKGSTADVHILFHSSLVAQTTPAGSSCQPYHKGVEAAQSMHFQGTAPSLMVCSCPSEGADAAADGENTTIRASLGNLAIEHHAVVKSNQARHLAVDDVATIGRVALLHAPNQFVDAVVESSQERPAACATNSQELLHAQVLLHAPAQSLGAEAEGAATCTETPRLSRHPVLAVKATQARPAATCETPSFPAASSCPAADADDAGDAIIMDAFLRNLKAEDSAADEDPTADEDLGVAVPADASADATVLAALDTTSADNSAKPKSNTISGDDDDATAHLDAVKDSDSSRTPSPPHYSRGGRATFVLAESTSAPLQEFKTSSYYEEEQILCWCVRCRGTYRRPRRQCRLHESEYGVFVDAPAPSQRHQPMEYATSLDDEDDIYRRDAHQSRMRYGQAIQLLQIDILRQSIPLSLESETSCDYVLLDRLQSLLHTYNCRHYGGWEGGSLPRDGEVFSFWGTRYMIAPSSIPTGGRGLFIAQDLQVPPNSEAPAYDMEADVPLPSHMHGTSQMLDEYMRLLRKSDPKSYHKLKKQYEMDFDKAHEEYNDDNDMDEFINDW